MKIKGVTLTKALSRPKTNHDETVTSALNFENEK